MYISVDDLDLGAVTLVGKRRGEREVPYLAEMSLRRVSFACGHVAGGEVALKVPSREGDNASVFVGYLRAEEGIVLAGCERAAVVCGNENDELTARRKRNVVDAGAVLCGARGTERDKSAVKEELVKVVCG